MKKQTYIIRQSRLQANQQQQIKINKPKNTIYSTLIVSIINMSSPNSQSATNSRFTNTNTVSCDDELDRCEQINDIKARIVELEKHQASTRERKERFLQNRQERLRASRDVSLSISNNASAIFSTTKSRKVIDEQINKYENIATITQEQNNNLKQQNEYLLSKLKKMKEKQKKFITIAEKAQKYKQLYEEALGQLQIAKKQCQVYKTKAEEMKKIALLDVGKLEDKILPFVKTLDETESANSQAAYRGPNLSLKEELQARYSKEM